MAIDIIMPKMGESITEGTIVEWKKKIGDKIKKDETVLEISTDKVDSEVPSPASGVLLEIISNKNETVAVGSVLGYIGEEGESIQEKTPKKEKEIEQKKIKSIDAGTTSDTKDEVAETVTMETSQKAGRFYSPLVRSIAKKEGISRAELDQISGSGRGGRVNKTDILDYLKDKQTNVVLYTYDALLFDFSKNDGKQTLEEIEEILESGNKYPVKHKFSDNLVLD